MADADLSKHDSSVNLLKNLLLFVMCIYQVNMPSEVFKFRFYHRGYIKTCTAYKCHETSDFRSYFLVFVVKYRLVLIWYVGRLGILNRAL